MPSGDVVLAITGESDRRRFLVYLRGETRRLQPAVYAWLLELVTAKLSTSSGYLPCRSMIQTDADAVYSHTIAKRLNEQLGFVQTGLRAYRLMIPPTAIAVADGVFEAGSDLVDPRILDNLRRALDRHHAAHSHGVVLDLSVDPR